METIANIKCDFKEKFGIPRQSGLSPHSTAQLVFKKEYSNPEAFRGLEGMGHIWLIFQFHQVNSWSPTARPPRLGGNTRMGVFATRSPFRPNNIGLSLVELKKVEFKNGQAILTISGHDLLDQTPIIDIKPYSPSDIRDNPQFGWIEEAPLRQLEVIFSKELEIWCQEHPELVKQIDELLAQDPRPAFHNKPEKEYGMLLGNYNIRWNYKDNTITVIDISDESKN